MTKLSGALFVIDNENTLTNESFKTTTNKHT